MKNKVGSGFRAFNTSEIITMSKEAASVLSELAMKVQLQSCNFFLSTGVSNALNEAHMALMNAAMRFDVIIAAAKIDEYEEKISKMAD